jgi:hypothetical protein
MRESDEEDHMKIDARVTCKDIVGPLREGDYELPEGATAEDALKAFFAEAKREMNPDLPNQIVFLINYKRAQPGQVMHDGDKLRLLYKIMGG